MLSIQVRRVIISAIIALTVCPAISGAERPSAPKLLPKDTLAYARIADSQELLEKFSETAMGKLTTDDQIRPLVTQLYGAAAQAFQQVEENIGVSLDQILAIPQGEICAAVVGQEQGVPAFVALLEAGDQMPVIERLLDLALREAEKDGKAIRKQKFGSDTLTVVEGDVQNADGAQPAFCIREGVILFSTSATVLQGILKVWEGDTETATLSSNRKFTSVMKRSTGAAGERPQISFFVDPIGLFKNLSRDNIGAQAALGLLPALGLNGVRAAGGSLVFGTEQFDSIAYMHLLLDSPRKGILKMLAIESGDTTPENWVPYDSASYMTIYWDAEQSVDAFGQVYDMIRGPGALDNDLKRRFSNPLGVDFDDDILGQISGRITHVSWFEKPAKLNSGTNLIGIKLNDADAFRKTITGIIKKTGAPLTKKSHGKQTYYQVGDEARREQRFERRNLNAMLFRMPSPSFAVVGDYFLASDSSDCLKAAIENKEDPSKSLGEELDYKLIASKVKEQLGSTKPSSMIFQRPEESMRSFYSMAKDPQVRTMLKEAAKNNPFFKALDDALTKNPLPPFSRIAKYLAPGGGTIVSDDSGIHYTAFGLKRE